MSTGDSYFELSVALPSNNLIARGHRFGPNLHGLIELQGVLFPLKYCIGLAD
jgi:hypothetical protein